MSADPTAPGLAPARADLTYLRRRVHPARTAQAARKTVVPEAVGTNEPGSALDLSMALPPAQPPPFRARAPLPVVRVRSGECALLGPAAPMVTLNRLQSGVGALVFEALCSRAVGDLRLGCAYTLAGGHSSTVQHCGGRNSGPRGARSPVILTTRPGFERFTVDLRQIRRLTRLIVYGFSESGQAIRWGGTLVVTTFGGARVELPMDRPVSSGVVVFLSGYNVDGELVVRSEMEHVDGDVRDACQAYGFDRITWLDGRTPVD